MTERLVSSNDPAVQRLVAALRSALASYDDDDAGAPDRHSDECGCALCDYVRCLRDLVAIDDPAVREE